MKKKILFFIITVLGALPVVFGLVGSVFCRRSEWGYLCAFVFLLLSSFGLPIFLFGAANLFNKKILEKIALIIALINILIIVFILINILA